ncbi:N-acetylmuramoyl-L-alanine amidase [Sinomicrobium sp. M5D2P9]
MPANPIKPLIILLLILGGAISCSPNPYAATDRFYKKQAREYAKILLQRPSGKQKTQPQLHWVGTTNYNMRKPNYVVIHHTAQDSVEQTLRTFTLPRTSVSSHYVIAKNGTVYQMLNDYFRGWHAGAGKWGSNSDINSGSLGIELDNNGLEPFPQAQIDSLISLLKVLKEKYDIPSENFLGHADIAPARKNDPSIFFPWKELADNGFGIWYDDTPDIRNTITKELVVEKDTIRLKETAPPVTTPQDNPVPDFNEQEALKIIGYDISDPKAARKAFKIHYIQQNINDSLNGPEKAILYNMYKKFLHL